MNKLQCKICGGKLALNENDIAICDYCGMEYKPEAIQKMLVELGGPIEVQGISSKQRLIEKAAALERIGKIGDALKVYTEIAEEYPDEYIGFYKLCKIELDNLGHIHSDAHQWRHPFKLPDDQIRVLRVLNPEKAEEMARLRAQKLKELVEFDHEFDCNAFQSNLCHLAQVGAGIEMKILRCVFGMKNSITALIPPFTT